MMIRAVACVEQGCALQEWEYPQRELRPEDVLVRITHCGVCGTDVHCVRNEFGSAMYPVVPGHEIVGVVAQAGDEAQKRGFEEGVRVGVGPQCECCHECEHCTRGDDSQCPSACDTYNDFDSTGNQTFGGFAERIVVDCHKVVKIPDSLSSVDAAPLLCAGVTVYSALKRYLHPDSDRYVAVLGLGGLGHLAVKMASQMGMKVTVLSHSPDKEAAALALGASEFLDSSVASLGGLGRRFDVIVNTASKCSTSLDPLLGTLRTDGRLILLGMSPAVEFSGFNLFPARLQICGSYIGSTRDTQETLDYCSKHSIAPSTEVLPLTPEGCTEALRMLTEDSPHHRLVLEAPQ